MTRPPPQSQALEASASTPTFRDLVALTKPGITASNTLIAGAGLLLAGAELGASDAGATPLIGPTLFGTALVVAGASAFNMVLERESDRLMSRTSERPVAAGRVTPGLACVIATALATLGLVWLASFTNALATTMAALGLVGYAFVYTPLKRRTPLALHIGAAFGATPPLIGALAIGPKGLAAGLSLAALLFVWQFPHFLAIASRREADYRRAGLRAWSVTHGADSTRRLASATAWTLPVLGGLLPFSTGLSAPSGVLVAALGLYLALATASPRWEGRTFVASLVYLPALTAALGLDALMG